MIEWCVPFSSGVLSAAVLLALLLDVLWGEPPAACHPVVWMGRYLGSVGSRFAPPATASAPETTQWRPFIAGAIAWGCGACMVFFLAWFLQQAMDHVAEGLQVLVLGLCLKPLFAWRMLRQEVLAVEQALNVSLAEGRKRLSWLCSRDVSVLSAAEVRETAIETLAENLNDSVVAPLFWFLLAGLPGAALYRFANTADAMWGYKGERNGRDWTWAGKWAARADDALSWLPARLTGLVLMLGRPLADWGRWPVLARVTPSPNGGWPMSAMALALGVQLGKPGVYTLNNNAAAPLSAHLYKGVQRAGHVVKALGFCAGLYAAACWLAPLVPGGLW